MESCVKPFERLNTPDADEVIGTNIIGVFQVLYIARTTVVSADSLLIIWLVLIIWKSYFLLHLKLISNLNLYGLIFI